jgi:hypothetical protein
MEKDETEDRRGAQGENRTGGAAGAVDGRRAFAAIRGSPEPALPADPDPKYVSTSDTERHNLTCG